MNVLNGQNRFTTAPSRPFSNENCAAQIHLISCLFEIVVEQINTHIRLTGQSGQFQILACIGAFFKKSEFLGKAADNYNLILSLDL